MPQDRYRLERRRVLLMTAISYVEDQQRNISRDTAHFLDWARQELIFVDALLRQQQLLNQFLSYSASNSRQLEAA